jgi:uncharacterized protein (DUF305 family)
MKAPLPFALLVAVLLAPAVAAQAPVRSGPSAADVKFITGMIPHHAQAVKMGRWAPTHGASAALQRFAERIVVAQRDEIAAMRTWLRQQGQPVPDTNATHMMMKMGDMDHAMLMPGMLTDEEMAKLDGLRGVEFDRFFLASMIKHHGGAISMVDELFASYGAGQDEFVFRFASDVFADQTTEIEFLQGMLDALPPPVARP